MPIHVALYQRLPAFPNHAQGGSVFSSAAAIDSDTLQSGLSQSFHLVILLGLTPDSALSGHADLVEIHPTPTPKKAAPIARLGDIARARKRVFSYARPENVAQTPGASRRI